MSLSIKLAVLERDEVFTDKLGGGLGQIPSNADAIKESYKTDDDDYK